MAEKPVKCNSSPHPPPEMFWNAKPPHILGHIKVISPFRRARSLNAKRVTCSKGRSGGRPGAAAHAPTPTHGEADFRPPPPSPGALRGLWAAFLQVETAIRVYTCPYFAQTVTQLPPNIPSACLYTCVCLVCKHLAFVRVRVPHLERAQIP